MLAKLSLGPVLFHWPVDMWLDFYKRIADEAEIDRVYLGEVVCSKRAPFYEKHYLDIAQQLQRGGKEVVFSTLAEVSVRHDSRCVASICGLDAYAVEANDVSALAALDKRPHMLGPYMNVYNEGSLQLLALRGASHICLQPEIPAGVAAVLMVKAHELGLTTEVQVFGRVSLALSARCYHARKYGRTKDNCQYACEADPDGLEVRTLDDQPFLAINGIQTLSHGCLSLLGELPQLQKMGADYFRLSPHSCDMVAVARLFRQRLQGEGLRLAAAQAQLRRLWEQSPLINGFYHARAGQEWKAGRG